MHFSNPRAHGIPLFVSAKILSLNLLYFEQCRIQCMISQKTLPRKIPAITLSDVVQFTPTIPGPPRRKISISSIRPRTN